VALDPHAEEQETRPCRIEELATGMIIQQEIRAVDGTLIISKGQEVTSAVVFKLKNLQARHAISGDTSISVATMKLFSAGAASSLCSEPCRYSLFWVDGKFWPSE
jgi:hypothetical protein